MTLVEVDVEVEVDVDVSDETYAKLLALRTGLRKFLRWSEAQAKKAGLTGGQHQLLLAVRGHHDRRGPTIGEVADYLLLRHHSAVGLIDRADAAGLVERHRDPDDHRVVRLRLTRRGEAALKSLTALHVEELDRLGLELPEAWEGLASPHGPHGGTANAKRVEVARVYDDLGGRHGILVDRLWPRGLERAGAPFDEWAKDVAPSTDLRKWYGHRPERFDAFRKRYLEELTRPPASEALEDLRRRARREPLTLLTATKDLSRSGAAVLRDAI